MLQLPKRLGASLDRAGEQVEAGHEPTVAPKSMDPGREDGIQSVVSIPSRPLLFLVMSPSALTQEPTHGNGRPG